MKRRKILFFLIPLLLFLAGIITWNVAGQTLRSQAELRRISYLDNQRKKELQVKLREVNQLYKAGKKEEAKKIQEELYNDTLSIARLYEDFLKRYPRSKEALNYLGLIYYDDLAQPDLAKKYWEKALEIDPNFSPALNNLATYYVHFGEHIESIESFKRAVKINPNVAVYHANLFDSYILFRYEVAKKYGWSLPEVFENAIKEARAARKLEPNNFKYARDLAEIYYIASYFDVKPDWKKVLNEWSYCLSVARTPAEKSAVYLNIGRINLYYLNRKEEARLSLEKANELSPSISVQHLLESLNNQDGNSKRTGSR
ncbi:MAG: tetratricopeptide repeat protein [Caldiserica bacterium]|nr:tetratricopeptide repeat protein [Caldisericota bacterium]